MKRWLLLLLVMMAAGCGCAWADDDFRIFTDSQGREIRGRILSCDLKKKTVTLEGENNRKATISVLDLCKDDQLYIRHWLVQDSVRSETKFKISCERKKLESWNEEILGTIRYGGGTVEKDQVVGKNSFEKVGYEITLVNRNDFPVKGLVLKYCVFYKQDLAVGREGQAGILYKTASLDKLQPFKKLVITTDPVVLVRNESDAGLVNARVLKGEILGVALKLCTVPEKEGESGEVLRTFCYPESILEDHAWTEESQPIGANVPAVSDSVE